MPGVQGLEEGGLGDERLAGAGRGADENALLGGEPGQQGVFLDLRRLEGKLIEVAAGQFVAAGWHGARAGSREWGGCEGRKAIFRPRPS